MENENDSKVGAGIITISVLHFIGAAFTLIGSLILLGAKDNINNILAQSGQSASTVTNTSIAISLVLVIVLVIGVILILKKKALGVYLYFLSEIISIIYSIVHSGFSFMIILSLILPILMAVFIYQKKSLYGFGNKSAS
ncbi:membrane protein [Clostridium acetobutylicum]|nr:membrane protein [Clostridium acetobutylicum]